MIAHVLDQGWPVYPVHPRTVQRRRAPWGAKTDTRDAEVLAKTGRADFQALRRLTPESEQMPERKTLTRDQDALIQMQTRLVTQLTACLKADYPVAREVFGQLHQPSTLAFLRAYPPLQAARAAAAEELTTLLKHMAASDKEIERLLLSHADSALFPALPGAGTSPVLFQSGTDQQAHRRLGCIKPWRNALPQCAWQSTHQEARAKQYSQRKRAEGKSHSVAVRALAKVWARVLYAVWKTKEPYQTATFEAARRAYAPRQPAA